MTHRLLLVGMMAVLPLLAGCTNETQISEKQVEHVIRSLSTDDLMGRHAFSPEIDLAADFITQEFQNIGLSPLPGETDFRQPFTIHSITPSNSSITVNGNVVQEKHFFALPKEEVISWDNEGAEISYIGSEDSFREKFREYVTNDEHNLIAVHQDHQKWFHRYRFYFQRSHRTLEIGEEPNDVFVLASRPIQSYSVEFKNTVEPISLHNIAGMIEGKTTDEVVLFSAHYDHIGVISPADEDSIANGANDNASGVAGIIELARFYKEQPKPERTLYFVAFTAEEQGGFGSRYFSEQIDPKQITTMINIEMIGKPAIEGPNTGWITGFEYSDLGQIFQNNVNDSSYSFYPDPYSQQNLFFRSDNAPFAMLGVPAHSISTTPIDMDQDYHRVTDEYKTLDISHTTNTIRAIAKGAQPIISGQATPTRINPDSLRR